MKTSEKPKVDVLELFSPPCLSPWARKCGLRTNEQTTFDLTAGWDARREVDFEEGGGDWTSGGSALDAGSWTCEPRTFHTSHHEDPDEAAT